MTESLGFPCPTLASLSLSGRAVCPALTVERARLFPEPDTKRKPLAKSRRNMDLDAGLR
jgi:hypothetical protein